MVLLLLESGAIPNAEDCRGVKPIHEAVRKNHASIVRVLLEAGVDPLTPKTRENQERMLMCGEIITKGETAVEYVCIQGHTDTIMAILPFINRKPWKRCSASVVVTENLKLCELFSRPLACRSTQNSVARPLFTLRVGLRVLLSWNYCWRMELMCIRLQTGR